MSQALSVIYSLNPLLQISVFLSCWCALNWGLKTLHVSLLKALCFQTLSSLLPEAVGQNCGLLKNCFNTEATECQEKGPCFWSKAPSLSYHPSYTNLEEYICFFCPSQPLNCASLLKKPLLWSILEHLVLFGENPPPWPDLLSHVGFLWYVSAGAISPPIHHEKCCSWPHNNLSQPTSFNSAWASHGEEITIFFFFFFYSGKTRGAQMRQKREKQQTLLRFCPIKPLQSSPHIWAQGLRYSTVVLNWYQNLLPK